MLKSLSISNYALIDQVEIDFDRGFSVITGETGAGKSILLGALSLILGQRADVTVLKNPSQKCVVEATFNIQDYGFEELFEQNEIDYDHTTIIRREILPAGKSRAFINDTPLNLLTLKEIATRLIDIHSQHQTLLLSENHFQLNVVDLIAGVRIEVREFGEIYRKHKSLKLKLSNLIVTNKQQKNDVDFLKFQIAQIEELKLVDGEQELLESRFQEMTHSSEIKEALLATVFHLQDDDNNVILRLKEAKIQLERIKQFLLEGDSFISRLDIALIDLKDIASELSTRFDHIEFEPQELELIQQRLDRIYELQQKHRVTSIAELLQLAATFSQKLNDIQNSDEQIELIENELKQLNLILIEKAKELSEKRALAFPIIENSVSESLMHLGMPNAILKIKVDSMPEMNINGKDDIEFLFTANKNGALAEIQKVASGGEMSRLMLCIKALLSAQKGLPTLILDEIDSGVSGEIADKMGAIMEQMAKNIQVISITHLPQIAGRGKAHFKVFKNEDDDSVKTNIELLNPEERVVEIAKMLSGSELSDAAMKNARELIRN